MRLIEQEEERDRRPPWYMTPEQLLELQEEIQQQDRQLEQRLIDLRQMRRDRSHRFRRCCVVNVLEEDVKDVKKAKKEVKENDNAIVEKKVEKPVVCKQIQRELEEIPSSSVKRQYATVEYRKELGRFREQLGPTEGCSACELGTFKRHHSRVCKTRKLEWIEQNRRREHDQRQEGEMVNDEEKPASGSEGVAQTSRQQLENVMAITAVQGTSARTTACGVPRCSPSTP